MQHTEMKHTRVAVVMNFLGNRRSTLGYKRPSHLLGDLLGDEMDDLTKTFSVKVPKMPKGLLAMHGNGWASRTSALIIAHIG